MMYRRRPAQSGGFGGGGGGGSPHSITWANLTSANVIAANELQATAGGYTSGGSSTHQLPSSTLGYVELTAKVGGSYLERLWGMGTTGTGGGFARMNFALDLADAGSAIFVFESGSLVGGSRGTFTNGDVFRITRLADGSVTYAKNTVTFYTSLVNNTSAMYANGGAHALNGAILENLTLSGNFA